MQYLLLTFCLQVFQCIDKRNQIISYIQKEGIYSACLIFERNNVFQQAFLSSLSFLLFSFLSLLPVSFFITFLSHLSSLAESSLFCLTNLKSVFVLHSKAFPILIKLLKFTFKSRALLKEKYLDQLTFKILFIVMRVIICYF